MNYGRRIFDMISLLGFDDRLLKANINWALICQTKVDCRDIANMITELPESYQELKSRIGI